MSFNQETLTLSVRLMTFNHEAYISRAIEGCLLQKTTFKIEIVIGDDFSSDKTLLICQRYANLYPDKIRVLNRRYGDEYWLKRQELGRLYNFVDILKNCEGKYIALLDGDDYWINENKLQKQVDFLESNPGYVFTFHNTLIKIKDRLLKKDLSFLSGSEIHQEDLLMKTYNNFVPTASVVLKKSYLPQDFPSWFYQQSMGDWALNLFLLRDNQKAHFLNEYLSVYRRDGQGIWDSLNNISMTLKKRDFMLNLLHIDLSIDRQLLICVLKEYDKQLDYFVNELKQADYRNMSIKALVKRIIYRARFAIKTIIK